MKIRAFTAADYEAIADVHNAVFPDYKTLASDMKRWDDNREEKIRWGRFMAEVDGEVAGWGSYANSTWTFHPRKLWLEVAVKPEFRSRGIGAALYDRLLEAVAEYDPIVLRGDVREDNEVGRGYAERRGFAVDKREQESLLDITDFDPTAYEADLARVKEQGLVLRSWSEVKDTENAERRLHEVVNAVAADVPSSDPHTGSEFEVFRKTALESPNFLPDLNIIAMDGEKMVGISNLWKEATEGRVETGLTGVRREYRKRGLATAMKVKALADAKRAGFEATITWNEENNRGMLGINRRLGFQFRPAWLMIEKVIDAEALAATLAAEPKEEKT